MGCEGKDKGGGRFTYESAAPSSTPPPPPSHYLPSASLCITQQSKHTSINMTQLQWCILLFIKISTHDWQLKIRKILYIDYVKFLIYGKKHHNSFVLKISDIFRKKRGMCTRRDTQIIYTYAAGFAYRQNRRLR